MEKRTINLMYQGPCDGTVEAFEINGHLCIPGEDGVTYVTWENVLKFFPQARNLTPDPVVLSDSLADQLKRVKNTSGWDEIPYDLHVELDRLFNLMDDSLHCAARFDLERLRKDMKYWIDNLSHDFKSWWLHMPIPVPRVNASGEESVDAYLSGLTKQPNTTPSEEAKLTKNIPSVSEEPDWSDSRTLETEAWKNPLLSKNDRLQIADGAVAWRDEVIANLRQQLREKNGETQ